jgi:hypothetical protein
LISVLSQQVITGTATPPEATFLAQLLGRFDYQQLRREGGLLAASVARSASTFQSWSGVAAISISLRSTVGRVIE